MLALNIGAYELIYEEGQCRLLGESFIPFYAVSVNRPIYRELSAFLEFSKCRQWEIHDISGLFSPKFYEKSGVSGGQFDSFLKTNPGFDLYLFHPFPRERSIASHFLELAELEHPGITSALRSVWNSLFGRDLPVVDSVNDGYLWCHCNYFLGSRKFWEEYSLFVQNILELMESGCCDFLLELTPYTLSKTVDSFLPLGVFVFERSLTHFIADRRDQLKIVNFSSTSNWMPPELFAGEAEVVKDLLQGIESVPQYAAQYARELAVKSYFYRRKLGVIDK